MIGIIYISHGLCLEKRTEKGPEVSGHIKVNISVTVEGERIASFHQYYTKLHEVCSYGVCCVMWCCT